MPDPCKQFFGVGSLISEFHTLFSPFRARRTKIFAYGFLAAFALCTAFLAFNPPEAGSSPWFDRLFSTSVSGSYRSQFSSLFSRFFPGSDSGSVSLGGAPVGDEAPPSLTAAVPSETRVSNFSASLARRNASSGVLENPINGSDLVPGNRPQKGLQTGRDEIVPVSDNSSSPKKATKKSSDNSLKNGANQIQVSDNSHKNGTNQIPVSDHSQKNGTNVKKMNFDHSQKNEDTPISDNSKKNEKSDSGSQKSKNVSNLVSDNSQRNKTAETGKQKSGVVVSNATTGKALENPKREVSLDSMRKCNIFEGGWVKDDSYPLYKEGSCPHVDEPFDCFLNGRPDRDYQKLRWQPNGCNIPRLNGTDMLERLRGKRLVFVGDSLNRNMWESLVCVLRNSVQDKRKVFEASGRREFRTEGAYSFLFKDYNCSVEFFRSPFLVQEWENPEPNGSKKETLRLDLIERKSDKYKQADIIVFNTGHWWTHEKTSLGKDYYQEGSHVYGQLNVVEAFRKALVTWARWVDSNVNRNKTLVFFRGYSASHFSGGQWNSGGGCDSETLPIYNKTYLSQYPEKMYVLENVIKGMKTPISYLNITRMTDYRKDAHPSIYRKRDLTSEERRSPLRYQDCSHWCLPGVPDSWNELLYAQLLIKLQ